jgi:chromate transporter
VAHRRSDGAGAGAGRVHTRSPHHGHPVRGVLRRLERARLLLALLYGTLGAAITAYATFLPCFLFIFLLAPYIELLANNHRLRAILVGVTAAIVGVVANLAVFFASRVLFPDGFSLAGLDVFALTVGIISFVVLQRFKPLIYLMVPVGALLGMLWTVALG